jgi:glutamine---fructose-6-phosphate transaminase (isomerizing)
MLSQTNIFKEIYEQPQVLRQLLKAERTTIQELAAIIRDGNIHHIVIAARGTSDNAGRFAQYVLGAQNEILVSLATPSLYSIYRKPPSFGNALVLGISQSGQSPDIVSVLAEAKRQGNPTAVFTNSPQSDIAKYSDVIVNVQAGREKAVAATKSYTAELMAAAMLSAALSDDAGSRDALKQIPDAVSAALEQESHIAALAARYRYMRHCVVLGRGYNYATAFEIALKMKELTYTLADPYSSADFLHGPLALIEPGFPALVVAPSGQMLSKMWELIQALRDRQAEVVVISDDDETLEMGGIQLRLPQPVPEWLSPIPAIIPGQLLAMHLTWIKKLDPDNPRGLLKVTETH